MMANTYVPIQSVTLASSAASVTFSAIPQTYTDLVVRFTARETGGGDVTAYAKLVFNSDTSANYSDSELIGNGSSASSSWVGGDVQFTVIYLNGGTTTANTFGSTEIYIPNYTSTSSRPVSWIGVSETNAAAANMAAVAGLYRGASAISSLTITAHGGTNWVAGSTFHLYGIKNS